MSELNFNSILDGVSLALHAAFPASQVHGGNVKQGLKPGDFNVVMPSSEHTKEVGLRYRRIPAVEVFYYPSKGYVDCYDIAHQVAQALENITTPEGDIIHTTSCKWTITAEVLCISLRYDHFVRTVPEENNMETLTITQEG